MEYRVVRQEVAAKIKTLLKFVSDDSRPILSAIFFDEENMISANGFVVNVQKKPDELKDLMGSFKIGIIGRMPGGLNRVLVIQKFETDHSYPDVYSLFNLQKENSIEIRLNSKMLKEICESANGFGVTLKIFTKNSPVLIEANNENHFLQMPIFFEHSIQGPVKPTKKE